MLNFNTIGTWKNLPALKTNEMGVCYRFVFKHKKYDLSCKTFAMTYLSEEDASTCVSVNHESVRMISAKIKSKFKEVQT